jgi:hypothetical protein
MMKLSRRDMIKGRVLSTIFINSKRFSANLFQVKHSQCIRDSMFSIETTLQKISIMNTFQSRFI